MNNENELTAALATIEKCRAITGCPAGVDLQDHIRQLAAENVGLKVVFSQEEIPDEAVDAFSDTVAIDSDWDESGTWSYVENETEVIRAVLDALKPETPTTDRIVVEAEARGVEKFAAEQRGVAERLKKRNVPVAERSISFCLDSAEEAEVFAKQLREGASE
ncbi:TPA: hypothetical protein ACJI3O_002553 [Raoultella ornithinolytica]